MTTSGRRPVNKPAGSGKSAVPAPSKGAATSGRKAAPPAAAPRPRPRPDDEVEQPSGAKQFMFFGTIALVIIVIVLFVVKWETITAPPPKVTKPKVIKDEDILVDVKALRSKANDMFRAAMKQTSAESRKKGILDATAVLSQAQDKLQELGDQPRYKDKEEYDAVFEEIQSKISLDMKQYRESIRMSD